MRMRTLLLLAAASISASAQAATFGELVERYGNLSVGEAAVVANVNFAVGHFKLVMTDGKAAPVLAGKETVGIFFRGNGTLQYEEVTPPDLALVAANTKNEAHLKVEADAKHAVLSGPVTEVLLLSGGATLPQLTGGGGGSLAAELAEHQSEFRRDRSTPFSHGLILQNLAAPSTQYVRAEVRSGRDELVYVFDGHDTQNEMLYALKHPESSDSSIKLRLYGAVLAQQPIGRDIRAYAKPPFTLTAIDYTLTGDGDDAKLAIAETIQRQSAAQNAVRFELLDSVFVKPGSPFRHYHA